METEFAALMTLDNVSGSFTSLSVSIIFDLQSLSVQFNSKRTVNCANYYLFV